MHFNGNLAREKACYILSLKKILLETYLHDIIEEVSNIWLIGNGIFSYLN